MGKKYATEEERKVTQREYKKQWYQANKERIAEYKAEYYQANKEKIAEYYQANKEKKLEYQAEYYQANKEKVLEQQAEYRKTNKEKKLEYQTEYNATPIGRAIYLLGGYRRSDKKYNRGECALTPQWIVDNIFAKPCHYCGETDWRKIGCDRIDNDKSHTEDNVVPCCGECNKKRGTMEYNEFVNKMKNEDTKESMDIPKPSAYRHSA